MENKTGTDIHANKTQSTAPTVKDDRGRRKCVSMAGSELNAIAILAKPIEFSQGAN